MNFFLNQGRLVVGHPEIYVLKIINCSAINPLTNYSAGSALGLFAHHNILMLIFFPVIIWNLALLGFFLVDSQNHGIFSVVSIFILLAASFLTLWQITPKPVELVTPKLEPWSFWPLNWGGTFFVQVVKKGWLYYVYK